MRGRQIKIYPYNLLILLFIIPAYISSKPELHLLFQIWVVLQIIAVVCLFTLYVLQDKMKCAMINVILLLSLLAAISATINDGSPFAIGSDFAANIGIALYIYRGMNKNQKRFLKTLAITLCSYVIINLVIVLLFPTGIASGRIGQYVWFLGQKNSLLPYIVDASIALVLYFYAEYGKNTAKTFAVVLLMCSTALFVNSANFLVIAALMVLGMLLEVTVKNKNILLKLLSGQKYFILVVAFFLFVMLFSQNNLFMQSFTKLIGRDITFSGRTLVWEIALEQIKAHPIIGVGTGFTYVVSNWSNTMVHAHSIYLDIAVRFGIPALGLVLIMIVITYRRSRAIKSPLAFFYLTLYLVGAVFDVYSLYTLILPCMLINQANPVVINLTRSRQEVKFFEGVVSKDNIIEK